MFKNFAGMGTKVQCKSYIPGYHPMRDLNDDSSGSWSLYHEDKTFSEQLYNGFKVRQVNEYSEYDKEMLKRIMLEHEAVFRKQVCELHRLYSVQKYLMDELKREESYRYSAPMGASHSNIFSSQMPHEVHGKVWQMPHQPLVNTSYGRAVVPDVDDKKPPLSFLKVNNMQYSAISPENGGSFDDRPFDHKLKRPKRMFDLHLPADVYIDSEDAERTEKDIIADSCVRVADPLCKIHGVEPENNVKLTLGTGDDGSCGEGSWKSDLHTRGGLSIHSLADLNEPIKDLDGEEAAGSVSNGLRAQHKEVQGHQLPMKSSTDIVCRDFFRDGHGKEGSCSNFINADKKEIRQEWQSLHNDAGQSRNSASSFNSGSCNDKYPMSSESIKLKLKKAHETQLLDQTKSDTWFREKTTQPTEIFGRSPHLVCSNNSVETYPQMTGPLSVVSQSVCSSATSLPASFWRKPTHGISHIPIAVQALPCFNGSVAINAQSKSSNAQKPNNASDKLQRNGDLKSHMQFGSKFLNGLQHGLQLHSKSSANLLLPSATLDQPNLNTSGDSSAYQNSNSHGVQKCLEGLQCTDNKPGKGAYLNQSILNGIIDGFATKQDSAGKHDGPSKGLTLPRRKSACNRSSDVEVCAPQMELDFTKDFSQRMPRCEKVCPEFASEGDNDKGSSVCVPDHSLSPFQIRENIIHRHEVSDGLNGKRNPGFLLLDKIQQSAKYSPLSCHKRPLADEAKFSEKGKGARNHTLSIRNNINLNSSIDEAEAAPSLSIPGVATNIACKIDLEKPVDAWEEGAVYSQGKITGLNHLKKSLSKDGPQETEFSCDIPLRAAAEIMISMSLDVSSHSNVFTFCLSSWSSCDSLQWFAEVVLSSTEIDGVLKGRADGGSEPSDDDETDSFELMTLKLEAMKEDEYMSRSWELEKPKDEEAAGTASLLLTRPRRGQARKRRQRRDFQKDILPGLASLSRHEVAEDLQIFGGLMRASGKPWQVGSARRSSGPGRQTRGRRRQQPGSLSEVHVSPPRAQPAHAELEIGGTSMVGWGRTTRRCRRQRLAPGNASVPHN